MFDKREEMTPEQLATSNFHIRLRAYLLVVLVGVMGFFLVQEQQDQLAKSQSCTESLLNDTISVLNARTSYTGAVQVADEAQYRARLDLLKYSLIRPASDQDQKVLRQKVEFYFDKLRAYLKALHKAKEIRSDNAYPTPEGYRGCLNQE